MTATEGPVEQLLRLRQHQHEGRRSPHKPLLALLALGNLTSRGTSEVSWSEAEERLSRLIGEFGRGTSTAPAQSAAYPFTRLRSDGVWVLDAEVGMDNVGPLREQQVTGRFAPALEAELLASPARTLATARVLATSNFPDSVVSDVLIAAGLDPDEVLGAVPVSPDMRRRSTSWRLAVLEAWDKQCAFCGYDGQLAEMPVGLDAAHVRWFSFDGPDDLDNGLALCTLHHKLFDRGVLGLDVQLRVLVSRTFTARTLAGRTVYELHGQSLSARSGTPHPREEHVHWHTTEVFKSPALAG